MSDELFLILQVYKRSNSPSYKERFLFALEPTDYQKRSLSFYIYATDRTSSSLLGEAELRLCDVSARQPVTTWLTLTDTGQVNTAATSNIIITFSEIKAQTGLRNPLNRSKKKVLTKLVHQRKIMYS